ncbi:MAG: nucleoside recognition membrane protein YjiH [Colwellia sp.]|jgi:nucleoside recognition membrane protein YjiH
MKDAINSDNKITLGGLAGFLIPSLLGILLFLLPVEYNGKMSVILGIMSEELNNLLGNNIGYFTTFIFVTSATFSLIYSLLPSSWAEKTPYLYHLFKTTPIWLFLRVLGGIVSTFTLLQIGPEWLIGKDTGITAFIDVAGIIFCLIGIGCLLLPLLTDYGFLEFVGVLFRKGFQKIFGLPGRSTIDVLASWVGSSSIASLLTIKQYETGFYTTRESSVIVTNFSVVSVPFVILTANVAGISEYVFQLYGSMIAICILCAIITPKLPPLSNLPDEYYPPVGKQIHEAVIDGGSTYKWALEQALKRAASSPSPIQMLKNGSHSLVDLFFTMMPAAMTIEFLALSIYHHTSIFHIIATPVVPVLELLGIPMAYEAAPGVLVGLLDQFVPAIIAGGIDNPLTSFVLAGLSVTQLIFFAEIGILILRSKIPLNVKQLVVIFCIRTCISLPLLALFGHMIF